MGSMIEQHQMEPDQVEAWLRSLREDERSQATLEKYRRDVTGFFLFLPKPLCRLLVQYIRTQEIGSGPVFVTRSGRPMDRSNIWAAMKAL